MIDDSVKPVVSSLQRVRVLFQMRVVPLEDLSDLLELAFEDRLQHEFTILSVVKQRARFSRRTQRNKSLHIIRPNVAEDVLWPERGCVLIICDSVVLPDSVENLRSVVIELENLLLLIS